jgi:5,10-methylenetetrahydrofolate reductase
MLKDLTTQKSFLVTSEIDPPKGTNYENVIKMAESIAPLVDALNVTDGQSAIMRMGSLPICHMLLEHGILPIFQLTCRDRNRIALQSEILNAYAFGIKNILCLTGDHVSFGDHPQAKPVFDLDSVSLLSAVNKLNSGIDLNKNKLNGSTKICTGAVVNPGATAIEPQLFKMERKIKAGATFFQTQAVFEFSNMNEFIGITEEYEVPLLMGIMLLKSSSMARYLNAKVPGIKVPNKIIAELDKAKDPIQVGIDIAARLIVAAKDACQGIHIMTNGREDLLQTILQRSGLLSTDLLEGVQNESQ